MKSSAILLRALLFVILAAAAAAAQNNEIAISAFGVMPSKTTGYGVQETGTKSGGGLFSYRHFGSAHSGLEVNYGFSENSNKYTNGINPASSVQTKQTEITGAYVFRLTRGAVQPFALAGAGLIFFRPTQDAINDADPNVSPTTHLGGLAGAGVDVSVRKHMALRAQYRVLVVESPDFYGQGYALHTNAPMFISEPSVGVVFKF
jgi:opacity protein-like surface antigen